MKFSITPTSRNLAIQALGANTGCTVRFFGGEAPSAQNMKTWKLANLPANHLVSFTSWAATTGWQSGTVINITTSNQAAASATGTATWFAIALSADAIIFGKVSDLAGDGDLKMPSTEITAGNMYGLQNFNLTIPLNYEF